MKLEALKMVAREIGITHMALADGTTLLSSHGKPFDLSFSDENELVRISGIANGLNSRYFTSADEIVFVA